MGNRRRVFKGKVRRSKCIFKDEERGEERMEKTISRLRSS
jgi:hypothetical protein